MIPRLLRRRLLLVAVVYTGSCVAMWVLSTAVRRIYAEDSALAASGATAIGVVIDTSCQVHETFTYEFRIASGTYRGTDRPGRRPPHCRNLARGQSVRIWYLPSDPTVNVAGDPEERRSSDCALLVVMFLAPILLAGLAPVLRWRILR